MGPGAEDVTPVCPFCEATCGLAVEVEGNSIVSVRGDKDDPFSRGYICPKAYGLKELHDDHDRLRSPVRRTANGWEEITWDDAYAEIGSRMLAIREKHGPNAIGMYLGNPMVHDFAFLYFPVLARARQPHHFQSGNHRHAAQGSRDRPDVRRTVSFYGAHP